MATSSQPYSTLRMIRNIVTVVVMMAVIVLIMMWLMGVFRPKIAVVAATQPAGRAIDDTPLADVLRVRVPVHESASGTVRAVHETSVASKLLAKVTAVHVKAGQAVTKGMVLVELDSADLTARLHQAQAAVDSAKAKRDQAKVEFERIERLDQQNAAAPLEREQTTNAFKAAEAGLRQAEQGLKEAETIVGYASIRSPIDGVAVDKKIEVGDTAQPGQTLVTLYDPTRMQLVASVRESLTHQLQVGKEIPVEIDALDLKCHGTISEIVPEAESASRSFSVKVIGPCPPGVYAGMFGRLMIPLDDTQVLAIPRAAVRRIGQLSVVEVAENGRLIRRAVQTGRSLSPPSGPELVQVLSGLQAGEKVALADGPLSKSTTP